MKTKKLKKLWSKYQTAHREIKDIQEEFQQERTDMLDTIRELTRQLKLKEVMAQYGVNVAVVIVPVSYPRADRRWQCRRRLERKSVRVTGMMQSSSGCPVHESSATSQFASSDEATRSYIAGMTFMLSRERACSHA